MLGALTKPLEGMTAADIEELVERGWPESENVEYKSELHRERDQKDPWYSDGQISEASKKKIFKELVAFANTSGGRLFLGIGETREKPPRAEAVQPVPRCADLAERLEQAAISSIDPPITFLRAIGVPTESDGTSGVVIVNVSASYSGPHRSPDLRCYVRKGTSSVPIGMREIHDIVMRLSRRQDEIQRRLSERQELFERWVGRHSRMINLFRVGFRVTALPVGAPLHVERVFGNPAVSCDLYKVSGTWGVRQAFSPPRSGLGERPILGGTRWSGSFGDRLTEKVIYRDGLIDIWFKWPWYRDQHGSSEKSILPLDWIVATAVNALVGVQDFRNAAQAPTCEYGLEVELLSTDGSADTALRLARPVGEGFDLFDSDFETPAMLGPYGIGDSDDVMNRIVRDLYDAGAKRDDPPKLEIDWPTH